MNDNQFFDNELDVVFLRERCRFNEETSSEIDFELKIPIWIFKLV
jgi:hypothetical protein